jgi:hypothetical protein
MNMNLKLDNLVEQAKYYTNADGETYKTNFKFEERFAKLIIKDVAEFVGKQRNDIPATGAEFENAIKYYYGIDE